MLEWGAYHSKRCHSSPARHRDQSRPSRAHDRSKMSREWSVNLQESWLQKSTGMSRVGRGKLATCWPLKYAPKSSKMSLFFTLTTPKRCHKGQPPLCQDCCRFSFRNLGGEEAMTK